MTENNNNDYRRSPEADDCFSQTEELSFTSKSHSDKQQPSIRERLIRYGPYDKLQG